MEYEVLWLKNGPIIISQWFDDPDLLEPIRELIA